MSAPFLTLPASAKFANVAMTLSRVVSNSSSPFTKNEQFFDWQGEQWIVQMDLPPTNDRAFASEWIAFGLGLKGTYGRFLFGDPSAKNPRGVATGTPLVKGAGQTGSTLLTDGWTANTTNIMRAGDYIQIGTGIMSRLHMLLQDVNSDSGGNATLSIAPALRYSPADNAGITVTNAQGVFRMDTNDYTWSVSPAGIYQLSFGAIEVIDA